MSSTRRYIVRPPSLPVEATQASTRKRGAYCPEENWLYEVYQQVHGTLKGGWVVVCLDGNRKNTDPDNLAQAPPSLLKALRSHRLALSRPAFVKLRAWWLTKSAGRKRADAFLQRAKTLQTQHPITKSRSEG